MIVSLWAVADAPTAELMTEFYRQLKQTGDKAQSLRQAMLKLKEKHPSTPKNWAAFTLLVRQSEARLLLNFTYLLPA